MKELVIIVFLYVKLYVLEFNLDLMIFENNDFYVYVLEGVIFKDGFLVGIIMVIVIMLVVSKFYVRKDFGMIGEIILCGYVLLIGGLKEKVIVVLRSGLIIILILK